MARAGLFLVAFLALAAASSASGPRRLAQAPAPAPASGGLFDSLLAQGKQLAQDAIMKQLNTTLANGAFFCR